MRDDTEQIGGIDISSAVALVTIRNILNDRTVYKRKVICEKTGCSPEDPLSETSEVIKKMIPLLIFAESLASGIYGMSRLTLRTKTNKIKNSGKLKTGYVKKRNSEENTRKRRDDNALALGKKEGIGWNGRVGIFQKIISFLRKVFIRF
jgi:hypothetical protein